MGSRGDQTPAVGSLVKPASDYCDIAVRLTSQLKANRYLKSMISWRPR